MKRTLHSCIRGLRVRVAVLAVVLVLSYLAACTTSPSTSGPPTTIAPAQGSPCSISQALPDPACTPGAADPRVSQGNLDQTVCRPGGYTRSVRPPVSVTSKIKREQLAAYGMSGVPARDVELDHLIPLSVGGSSDVKNLWPEPLHLDVNGEDLGALVKDQLELYEREQLCAHRTTLAEAQRAFTGNWVQAWNAAGRPHPVYGSGNDD